MMSWNYRVIEAPSGEFYIAEVYYEWDVPRWYSTEVAPFGESMKELEVEFERMQKAFDKPTLKEW